jgi:23S rRNA (uracil1939-C5)-methyltransferase
MSGRVVVERLAPTGEGIARPGGKALFLDGALPGEEVEYEIFDDRRRFARGRVTQVRVASPDRRPVDAHAALCGGTDWAHMELSAAREAKRALFRETIERIGRIPGESLGHLPISPSPPGYRLRNKFHFARGPDAVVGGFFERRSHRVVPIDGCEIVSARTRSAVAEISAEPGETVRTIETVEDGDGYRLACHPPRDGFPTKVLLRLGTAEFQVSAASFFQVNRFLVAGLRDRLEREAAEIGRGRALDAFAGVGLWTHALLGAGYRVVSVESSAAAVADSRANRARWGAEDRWEIREERFESLAARDPSPFDVVVADPPRGGLGASATALARLVGGRLFYVSCDPATLARDLAVLAGSGLAIEDAWLEDFFPLTHRVEAAVRLARR